MMKMADEFADTRLHSFYSSKNLAAKLLFTLILPWPKLVALSVPMCLRVSTSSLKRSQRKDMDWTGEACVAKTVCATMTVQLLIQSIIIILFPSTSSMSFAGGTYPTCVCGKSAHGNDLQRRDLLCI